MTDQNLVESLVSKVEVLVRQTKVYITYRTKHISINIELSTTVGWSTLFVQLTLFGNVSLRLQKK